MCHSSFPGYSNILKKHDEYQMSKTFKKTYGMTPGQYRQQLSKSPETSEENKK